MENKVLNYLVISIYVQYVLFKIMYNMYSSVNMYVLYLVKSFNSSSNLLAA